MGPVHQETMNPMLGLCRRTRICEALAMEPEGYREHAISSFITGASTKRGRPGPVRTDVVVISFRSIGSAQITPAGTILRAWIRQGEPRDERHRSNPRGASHIQFPRKSLCRKRGSIPVTGWHILAKMNSNRCWNMGKSWHVPAHVRAGIIA